MQITSKERPLCRAAIERRALRPVMVRGKWNGFQAVDPEGRRSHLSQGLKSEMRRLISEGYWPELCQS